MPIPVDFWRIVTELGGLEAWIFITLVVLAIYLTSPRHSKSKNGWLVFVLIPAVIVSAIIIEIIKTVVDIPRPCAGLDDCSSGSSFPSRHAATMFILATAVFLNVKNFKIRTAFIVLAILVSYSRVALNYHTYLDIIVGSLLGVFVVYIINLIYRKKIQG